MQRTQGLRESKWARRQRIRAARSAAAAGHAGGVVTSSADPKPEPWEILANMEAVDRILKGGDPFYQWLQEQVSPKCNSSASCSCCSCWQEWPISRDDPMTGRVNEPSTRTTEWDVQVYGQHSYYRPVLQQPSLDLVTDVLQTGEKHMVVQLVAKEISIRHAQCPCRMEGWHK